MAQIADSRLRPLEHPTYAPRARPRVLCLHCSMGSSRQWRPLAARIGNRRRIVAPDLLGYGNNPPWPRQRRLRLEDEVNRLLRRLATLTAPVDVVGHSFGAAVAVKLALTHPERVRSLCLYEPVLFGLLAEDVGSREALAEVFTTCADIEWALSTGDRERAAHRFIDFWSGVGTWDDMPRARRRVVSDRMDKVRADFGALLADSASLGELARLEIPVLCLSGARSPAAVRRIADLLLTTLPRGYGTRFQAAGHMGPISHAREVNESIETFLEFLSGRATRHATRPPHTPIAVCAV